MKHGNSQNGKLPVFRERLRLLQGDMSVTAFADKLGLSRQTVGFYLNGDRIPDALTLKEIAEKCGVSSDYLIGISDIRSPFAEVHSIVSYTGISEINVNLLHSWSEGNEKQATNIVNYLVESISKSPNILWSLFDRYMESNYHSVKSSYLRDDTEEIGCSIPDNLQEEARKEGLAIMSASKASKWYLSEFFRALEHFLHRSIWDETWERVEKEQEEINGTR